MYHLDNYVLKNITIETFLQYQPLKAYTLPTSPAEQYAIVPSMIIVVA